MDIKDIKELIELINSSDLALFELKQGELSIKMDKSLTRCNYEKTEEVSKVAITRESTEQISVKEEIIAEKAEKEQEQEVKDDNLSIVKSPMVGTFYGASAPGKAAFASEGSMVKPGQILCIIEAMKLMNEIETELAGEIVKVLVKDGDMVEYGQPLFEIRRS